MSIYVFVQNIYTGYLKIKVPTDTVLLLPPRNKKKMCVMMMWNRFCIRVQPYKHIQLEASNLSVVPYILSVKIN